MPHPTSAPAADGVKNHARPSSSSFTENKHDCTSPHKKPCTAAAAAVSSPSTAYSSHEAFLDHLNHNPDGHFLAPIHMYENEEWAEASDSDDDDTEEFEWDAGITDFALFHSDRRRAEESKEPLPSKWNDLLDKQTLALQRALDRRRAVPARDAANLQEREAGLDDLPSLTPDDSPSLRDDLDVESYHGQNEPRPMVPNYLTISVSPPEEEGSQVEEYASRGFASQPASHTRRKQQRPGLRHSRTMSGQEHAWRRPSTDMYTVGEELIDSCSEKGEEDEDVRGRGRW